MGRRSRRAKDRLRVRRPRRTASRAVPLDRQALPHARRRRHSRREGVEEVADRRRVATFAPSSQRSSACLAPSASVVLVSGQSCPSSHVSLLVGSTGRSSCEPGAWARVNLPLHDDALSSPQKVLFRALPSPTSSHQQPLSTQGEETSASRPLHLSLSHRTHSPLLVASSKSCVSTAPAGI